MANVASIDINFANGKRLNMVIDESAVVLTSPTMTGDHRIVLDAPRFPTGKEIADDPGKYDGTASDPTMTPYPPSMWRGNRIPPTWAECWKAPASEDFASQYTSVAEEIFATKLGAILNLSKLTAGQRGRLGLSLA
jgi:hypothetical protein